MADPIVHVIDDDELVLKTLTILFRSVNLAVRTYPTAAAFLETYSDDAPGCLVLDIRMPGMSGMELLEQLRARGSDLPVIAMSGHADVETAVKAMRLGAINFLRKPFKQQEMLEEAQRCIDKHRSEWLQRQADAELKRQIDQLTPREREILDRLVKGASSKEIGTALAISYRTVEAHRRSILTKFQIHSMFDLAQRVTGRLP